MSARRSAPRSMANGTGSRSGRWAYLVLTVLALLTLLAWYASVAVASADPQSGEPVESRAVPTVSDSLLPPRPPAPVRVQALAFAVNYNPASCRGTLAPWPPEAQAALDYAVGIWGALLAGDQPVEIDACWRTDMDPDVPGSSSVSDWYRDFPGAPIADSWYPVALANQIAGTDLNGDHAEIRMWANANFTWYFGLDGLTPEAQLDFATVLLHEMAHGLGLSGSMRWDDGTGPAECDGTAGRGCWGWGDGHPSPTAYDRFAQNSAGQNLVAAFVNGSDRLGDQLTSGDVFFAGSGASAANGGASPRLHAPSLWSEGSSFTHLEEVTYDATLATLMTPTLAWGNAAHHPDPIVLGMLADLGWNIQTLASAVPS